MQLTDRELWTLIHGMGLGALFLLAFAGGLAGFYSLRPEWLTTAGIRERITRLDFGTAVMAIVAWLTVITGTWIVYPWYRARPPEGTTDLERIHGISCSPTRTWRSGTTSGWSGRSISPGLRPTSRRLWLSAPSTMGDDSPTSRRYVGC